LRERREDIPDLVRHFLKSAAKSGLPARDIEPDGMELLKRHDWPGNVRELENIVLRMVAIHAQETVPAEVIAAQLSEARLRPESEVAGPAGAAPQSLSGMVETWLREEFARHGAELPLPGLYDRMLREVEAPMLRAALAATNGNQVKAADLLGVNRNTLRKKMRDLGIAIHAEIA